MDIPLFAHADSNLLTLLFQDDNGGLQCFLDEKLLDIDPIEGGILCFFGRASQILFGESLKPLYHRVAPKKIYVDKPRLSMQFQTTPRMDFILHPSSVNLKCGNPNPQTYHEFLEAWNDSYDSLLTQMHIHQMLLRHLKTKIRDEILKL